MLTEGDAVGLEVKPVLFLGRDHLRSKRGNERLQPI
jgi:hypothetical protein